MPAFRESCAAMPTAVVAKALRAAAGFAAHEESVWRQTRSIKRIPRVFRIRVDANHRLLIRWEKGTSLEVLDLIRRSKLETWIKQNFARA